LAPPLLAPTKTIPICRAAATRLSGITALRSGPADGIVFVGANSGGAKTHIDDPDIVFVFIERVSRGSLVSSDRGLRIQLRAFSRTAVLPVPWEFSTRKLMMFAAGAIP